MRNKRHVLQLFVILTCVLWGAQQAASQTFAQALEGVAASIITRTQEADDKLTALYPGLPVSVARTIQAVVATQQIIDAQAGEGIVASGVAISDTQILTAAHTILDGADGTVECQNVMVAAQASSMGVSATREYVTGAAYRYVKDAEDVALLELNASSNFRGLQEVPITKTTAQVGDIVYFVNFEPTSEGIVRSPTNPVNVQSAQDYSKPVIFTGTVVETLSDKLVVATGAGTSMGLGAPDVLLRKGASGGAVIDAQGNLMGLSVSSGSLKANHTAAMITREYGVRLPEHAYQIAYVQPVTESLVKNLRTSVVSCDD